MVDQAYWHLAKTYQALVDADPRARQALDDLNTAYAVLCTPRLREEYDATLRPAAATASLGTARDAEPVVQRGPERPGRRASRFPSGPSAKVESEDAPTEVRLRQLAGPTVSRQAPLQNSTRHDLLESLMCRTCTRRRPGCSSAGASARPRPRRRQKLRLRHLI